MPQRRSRPGRPAPGQPGGGASRRAVGPRARPGQRSGQPAREAAPGHRRRHPDAPEHGAVADGAHRARPAVDRRGAPWPAAQRSTASAAAPVRHGPSRRGSRLRPRRGADLPPALRVVPRPGPAGEPAAPRLPQPGSARRALGQGHQPRAQRAEPAGPALAGRARPAHAFPEASLPAAKIAVVRAWIDAGAPGPGRRASRRQVGAPLVLREARARRAAVPRRRRTPPGCATPSTRSSWPASSGKGWSPLRRPTARPCSAGSASTSSGLPPTLAELDAFVADRAPDAYDKVVERLLASPHYGERWARPWLDLARYADSNGYEKDNLRTAWRYRDYVISRPEPRPLVPRLHDRAARGRHAEGRDASSRRSPPASTATASSTRRAASTSRRPASRPWWTG